LATWAILAVGCSAIEAPPSSEDDTPDAEAIATVDAATGGPDAIPDAPPDAGCRPDDCLCQGLTDCTGTCANLKSDRVHCGECGRPCPGDRVCTNARCVCAAGEDCDGVCVANFASNDGYCGSCNRSCAIGKEACVNAECHPIESVAIAVMLDRPGDPTGWTDGVGNPVRFLFRDVGASSARYECQTTALKFAQSAEFVPCDGADGTRPEHTPTAIPEYPEGVYRTSVRVRIGSYTSPVVSHDYYVHRSLDKAQPCVRSLTDEQYLAIATSSLASFGVFSDATVVRNPFIDVTFSNVSYSGGYRSSRVGQALPASQRFATPSLRHRFVLSADRKYLLVRRAFASRQAVKDGRSTAKCQDTYKFGNRRTGIPRQSVGCDALILNSNGNGICVTSDPTKPGSLVVKVASAYSWTKLLMQDRFSLKAKAPCQPVDERTRAAFLCLPE
jgi:hypothetical protein